MKKHHALDHLRSLLLIILLNLTGKYFLEQKAEFENFMNNQMKISCMCEVSWSNRSTMGLV